MAKIFFCGDPHSRFAHIIQAVEKHRPDAIVLLGDQTAKQPLDVELGPILDKTEIHWIYGNHDADSERYYDNLFRSDLKGKNIAERSIVTVAGIRIAGIGGVFREKVWDGAPLKCRGDITAPKDFIRTIGAGNRWRGGLPLRHRATVFPSMIDALRGKGADVLVTHEAPDLHPQGNQAFTRLAEDLRVKAAYHGHHHEHIAYPGSVWRGVALCGITELDTETWESRIIDQGIISSRNARERKKEKIDG